nr:MAG TPA: hypothetical protein [Caudoviricetes sp.]
MCFLKKTSILTFAAGGFNQTKFQTALSFAKVFVQ